MMIIKEGIIMNSFNLSIFQIILLLQQQMKNKRSNIGANIEEFIDYKLKNKKQSEEEAKALILKNKYQRILDGIFKQIDSRRIQLENMEYETKKMRKGIWDSLITISNAIEKLEKNRYTYASKIRQMNEQKQKMFKEIQNEKKMKAFQQKQLQQKIRVILQQTQYYFQQKNSLMNQLTKKKNTNQAALKEKQPIVSEFHDKIIIQQDKITEIQQLKYQKQSKINQIKQNQRFLQLLKVNQLKAIRSLQQTEDKQCQERRVHIIQYISHINKAFIENKNVKENIEEMKIKMNELTIDNSLNDEEKQKSIKQKILETKQTRTGADIFIKESLLEESLKEIQYLKSKIIQLDSHQKDLIKKQEQVAKIQQAKDKQIKRLEQTIVKMEQSLAKR